MPCFCTKLIRTCLKTANRSPIRARIPLPEIHSRQVVKKPGIRPNSRKTRSKTPSRFICPYSTTQNPDFPDRNRIKKDLGGLAKPPDSPEKHKSGPDKKHLYINQLVLHEIDPGCPKTANRSPLRARIWGPRDTLFRDALLRRRTRSTPLPTRQTRPGESGVHFPRAGPAGYFPGDGEFWKNSIERPESQTDCCG